MRMNIATHRCGCRYSLTLKGEGRIAHATCQGEERLMPARTVLYHYNTRSTPVKSQSRGQLGALDVCTASCQPPFD